MHFYALIIIKYMGSAITNPAIMVEILLILPETSDDGTSRGGLYAGATAGGGVSAGAGLGGTVTKTGSVGVVGAGAGGKGVIKTSEYSPVCDINTYI